MAVITPVVTQLESLYGHTHSIVWGPMANGDTGGPVSLPGSTLRSVHVFGTFGVAGSVAAQGSNELAQPAAASVTWAPLHDAQGAVLAQTVLGIKPIGDLSVWFQPKVTAGDGTTALTVALMVARPV